MSVVCAQSSIQEIELVLRRAFYAASKSKFYDIHKSNIKRLGTVLNLKWTIVLCNNNVFNLGMSVASWTLDNISEVYPSVNKLISSNTALTETQLLNYIKDQLEGL